MHRGSFLHIFSNIYCIKFFIHSNRHEVIFYCGFDFISWLEILCIFSWTYWAFVCLLWKNICSGPSLIFKSGYSFGCWIWFHYTFWIMSNQMSSLQIFSTILYVVSSLSWLFLVFYKTLLVWFGHICLFFFHFYCHIKKMF